jgi:uncharacterized phiE125 gp8 family phage protein
VSWLPPVVTVEPATEPVTLTEAKAQCRVDGSDEDTLITSYVKSSRQLVEEYTGTKLVSQTCVLRCSSFADLCDLPIAPIASVTSVTYLDTAGTEQTLSTDVYEAILTGLEPHIRLKVNQSWPSVRTASDAIRVTVTAGYSTVPEPIRHAMLLCISAFFDGRATGDLPEGVHSLLSNYRRF